MLINMIGDYRAAIRSGKYAWPGGYPKFFITADGGVLSFEAAKSRRRDILEAIGNDDRHGGFRVVGMDINWEDTDLYCDDTGKPIESAYGEES